MGGDSFTRVHCKALFFSYSVANFQQAKADFSLHLRENVLRVECCWVVVFFFINV